MKRLTRSDAPPRGLSTRTWLVLLLAGAISSGCDPGEPPSTDRAAMAARTAESPGIPAQMHRPATLRALHPLLGACPASPSARTALACPHLVYLWTPQMPLSEAAIPEIEFAAAAMGVPVSILPAEAVTGGDAADSPLEVRALRTALIEAGATVHYPSIVLFDGVRPRGTAVVGHRRAPGYRAVLEPRVAALREGWVAGPPAGGTESVGAAVAPLVSEAAGDSDAGDSLVVVWRQTMNPPPGFFFRRAPGTRFISYDQRSRVILQHLETGEKLLGPGFIDFVPTPDGALFVTPSHSDGLEFYVASRVFSEARAGRGEHVAPVFRDPELDDQYPSVGILEDEPGVSTTYRILVSWFEGLAVREYRVDWGGGGDAAVTPVGPRIDACPGMVLSTPILSKDGREIAARDEATGTTKLFRYHDDGRCTELLDFGIPTSKVGFSDDGRRIAYSIPEGSTGRSVLRVYDRRSERVTHVPQGASRGLMIPEFVGPDSLLFIVADGPRGGPQEFRMVCCVR